MIISVSIILLAVSFLALLGSLIWINMQDDHMNSILRSKSYKKYLFFFFHIFVGYGLFFATFNVAGLEILITINP